MTDSGGHFYLAGLGHFYFATTTVCSNTGKKCYPFATFRRNIGNTYVPPVCSSRLWDVSSPDLPAGRSCLSKSDRRYSSSRGVRKNGPSDRRRAFQDEVLPNAGKESDNGDDQVGREHFA